MQITFFKHQNDEWHQISEGKTDNDGRVKNLTNRQNFSEGLYKLKFHISDYFKSRGQNSFYPFVEIVFIINNPDEHYHVPLLLSPYGYSTYRGS